MIRKEGFTLRDTSLTMPAVALRGMTILPGMVAHFDVSRPKSIQAVEEAMIGEQKLFLVTQKDLGVENPGLEELYHIGMVAEIKQVIKMQNNIVRRAASGRNWQVLSRQSPFLWQRYLKLRTTAKMHIPLW